MSLEQTALGLVTTTSSVYGGIEPLHVVGFGTGGLAVAIALILLLGYLDILEALAGDSADAARLATSVTAAVVPLLLAFLGIVVVESLAVLAG